MSYFPFCHKFWDPLYIQPDPNPGERNNTKMGCDLEMI